jgi:hypothetical protein
MPIKHLQVRAAINFFDPKQARAYLAKLTRMPESTFTARIDRSGARLHFGYDRPEHTHVIRRALTQHFGDPDIVGPNSPAPVYCWFLGAGVGIHMREWGANRVISFIDKGKAD